MVSRTTFLVSLLTSIYFAYPTITATVNDMVQTRSKTPAKKKKNKKNRGGGKDDSEENEAQVRNEDLYRSLKSTLDQTNTLLSSLLDKQEVDEVASTGAVSTGSLDLKQRPPSKFGPDAPTIVYVSVCITDIPQVNSADSTFEADFYVILDWEDPRVPVADGIDLGEVWNPGVRIINAKAVELGYTDSDRAMAFSLTAPGKLHYEQRYTGTLVSGGEYFLSL
jgi:hypothetical protein